MYRESTEISRLIYCEPGLSILKVEYVKNMPPTPRFFFFFFFGFCWKLNVLSVQYMACFDIFRSEIK